MVADKFTAGEAEMPPMPEHSAEADIADVCASYRPSLPPVPKVDGHDPLRPPIRKGALSRPLLARSLDRAGREWNVRASRNPYHYVDATRKRWDSTEFYRRGLELVEQVVDPVLEYLGMDTAGKRVLEIGCGIGRLFEGLAQRFSEVWGIDISSRMLEYGKSGCPVEARWIQGDGMTLAGVDDAAVDYIVSYEVMQHIPDLEVIASYVKESFRVLTPGGAFQIHMRRGSDTTRQAVVRQLPRPARQACALLANKLGLIEFKGEIDTWLGRIVEPPVAAALASEAGFTKVAILPDRIHSRQAGYWLVALKGHEGACAEGDTVPSIYG
ncbi:MAG: class I SAM-dependent methyltransferase [Acidimicrobiales bacterium]